MLKSCVTAEKALRRISALVKANEELAIIAGAVKSLIAENSGNTIGPDGFGASYASLEEKYNSKKKALDGLLAEQSECLGRRRAMETFRENFRKSPRELLAWDSSIWNILVEKAKVRKDGTIEFFFRDGTIIKE